MRGTTICVFLMMAASSADAQAGNSFPLSDGINRAPASVLHCVGAGNVAVPCGTSAQPLFVTGSAGLATAGNQTSQLASEQAIAAAAGTQQDAAYAGGSGSMISLLKGLVAALSSGITATPVTGLPVSRSGALPATTSTMVFPSNPSRHYLALQAPTTTAIWVNFVGGTATPSGTDCVQLSAGTLYESGAFVTRGAVNVYSPVAVSIAAWEG